MNHTKYALKEAIKFQRQKNKRYKIKKSPKWIYPLSLQIEYKKILKGIIQRFIDITNDKVKKMLLSWKEREIIVDGVEHIDWSSPEDELEALDDDFENESNQMFVKDSDKLKYMLLAFGLSVGAFNEKQWQKVFKTTLGFEPGVIGISEDPILKKWIYENVKLITNLKDEYKKKIENTIFMGYKKNESYATLLDKIEALNLGFSENRTILIARDQTNKLNGDYTKQRCIDAGVDVYIWRTMQDEKVRGDPNGKYPDPQEGDNHYLLEGKYCKFSDDSVYSEDGIHWEERTSEMVKGKPGDAINDRCFAEVVMESLERENE